MTKDTDCPYCDAGIEIDHDDGYGYSEGDLHQQECEACGKTFIYTTSISFAYSTKQADCLNGGEHQYKTIQLYPTDAVLLRCRACGHEVWPKTEEQKP